MTTFRKLSNLKHYIERGAMSASFLFYLLNVTLLNVRECLSLKNHYALIQNFEIFLYFRRNFEMAFMRRYIIAIIVCLVCIDAVAQTKWTKSERNNLYEDCISSVSKNSEISKEQKESICLCYIDEISKKYPSEEYHAKIEVELKRIADVMLAQCSKNLGISLGKEVVEEQKVSKEKIKGHWKDSECEFWLNDDDTYTMKYSDGKSSKGTWNVSGNELNLYQKGFLNKKEKYFNIIDWSEDKFVYQSTKNKSQAKKAVRIK